MSADFQNKLEGIPPIASFKQCDRLGFDWEIEVQASHPDRGNHWADFEATKQTLIKYGLYPSQSENASLVLRGQGDLPMIISALLAEDVLVQSAAEILIGQYIELLEPAIAAARDDSQSTIKRQSNALIFENHLMINRIEQTDDKGERWVIHTNDDVSSLLERKLTHWNAKDRRYDEIWGVGATGTLENLLNIMREAEFISETCKATALTTYNSAQGIVATGEIQVSSLAASEKQTGKGGIS